MILVRYEHRRGCDLEYENDADEKAVGGEKAFVLANGTVQSHEANHNGRNARYDEKQAGSVQAARIDYFSYLERLPKHLKMN